MRKETRRSLEARRERRRALVPVLGARVRIARERLGLGPLELARRVDLSDRTLYNLESGRFPTNIGTLADLSRVLGVSTDWLLGLTNERQVA